MVLLCGLFIEENTMTKKAIHTLSACGEENGKAKLNARKVRRIRAQYGSGLVSLPELGRMHGVTHSCIFKVVTRHTWGHIK